MEQLSHNSDQGETWLTQVYASVTNFGNGTLGASLEDYVEWPRRRFADLLKPALADDSVSLASPACAPKPSPTSWSNDVGTQIMVDTL